MPPKKTTKRTPRKKTTSSRSKNLTKVYKEEFDDAEDSVSDSTFKMPRTAQKSMGKTIFVSLIIGVFIGGGLGLFYSQQQAKTLKNEQTTQTERSSNRTIEQRIEDLVRYNADDKPVVAMVKDVSMIQDIPLYQFAQNGDKVVVYKDMTVIYDEKLDKVVSVVPQNILKEQVDVNGETTDANTEVTEDSTTDTEKVDTSTDTTTNADTQTTTTVDPKDVTVEVRNGTNIAGLAGKRSREISTELSYTTKPANAARNNYTEGIIVDLSDGTLSAEIEKIRAQLDIKKVVTELPSGEASSTSKIVVILAK